MTRPNTKQPHRDPNVPMKDVGPSTPASQKKLRRITRACDYCHKRSIRCRFPGDGETNRCQNCTDFDQPCRFDRVVKRRGAKPKSHTGPSSTATILDNDDDQETGRLSQASQSPLHVGTASPWRPPKVASQAVIIDLVEIYFEIAYPTLPIFHRPAYLRQITQGDYVNDRYSFACTMAMCALVVARAHDHAVFNPTWNTAMLAPLQSEDFYSAAVQACGNISAVQNVPLDLLRAHALLAITSIQYRATREMHSHIGHYHTLVAMQGLHNEDNWPEDIGVIETEERRRLFWSMYSLDVFVCVVWDGVIRCREQQSNVGYPTEIDDEYFDDTGYHSRTHSSGSVILSPTEPSTISSLPVAPSLTPSPHTSNTPSWLMGFNFTTDLWRTMEHVISTFRDRRRHRRSFVTEMFGAHTVISASSIRDGIMNMYGSLPQCFKETQPVTCDMYQDRYGFMAANITATVQLLRMVLFSSGGAGIEERCKIASEVVDAFMRIPVQYLQALSIPLLHQLAGIGSILGSVFEEPLSESAYLQVRVVLQALAQLLENLDHGLHSTNGAERLRDLVRKVDIYMDRTREDNPNVVHPPTFVGHSEVISPRVGCRMPFSNRRISTIESETKAHVKGIILQSQGGTSENMNGAPSRPASVVHSAPEMCGMRTASNRHLYHVTLGGHHQNQVQAHGERIEDWPWNMDLMTFPEQ